jgi:hypothetical protein
MMKRLMLVALLAMVALALAPLPAAAEGETVISAAGEASFPEDASFSGIPLSGSTFGFGASVAADGTASGDVDIVLVGTAPLGGEQKIVVVGNVATGARNVDGSATLGGTASVDMGDGTPRLTEVPFVLTANAGGLQLVLGTTTLPAQTLALGAIDIQ